MDQDKLSAAKLAAEELSLEDLRALRQWITLEQEPKLEAAPFVAQEQARIMRELRESGAAPRPEAAMYDEVETLFKELGGEKALANIPAWHDPKGKIADGYEQGDVVVHEGAVFRSGLDGMNVDMPGSSDLWDDVTKMLQTADFDPPKED